MASATRLGAPRLALPPFLRTGASGAAGVAALLLAWQLVVGFGASGNGTVPTPWQILRQIWTDGPLLYASSALDTLDAAAQGWLWGNLLAVALALLVLLLPAVEGPVLQLGVAAYCLPAAALGPILLIVFSGDTPRVVLAAQAVFFTTLIGALIGLRSTNRTILEVVHAFGGSTSDKLLKVQLRAALPSLLAALRIATPAAILGAIVAEYFGAENGLGVLMINAQQGLEISRTWAVAVVATVVAGGGYGLTSLAATLLVPWAREMQADLSAGVRVARDVNAQRRGSIAFVHIARQMAGAAGSLGIVLLAWWGILRVLEVSAFVGKGPLDVWHYLSNPEGAAERHGLLLMQAAVSARDAALGLVAGTLAAVGAAVAFNLWPAVQRTFIGAALALRSVPLVATTPLIVLVFGRNLLAITVIGGIVTFFPTLVNVMLALRDTPSESMDLMKVFGASRLATLWKAQIPNALPSVFASLRIAGPLAMTGAMLAEWLATGQGLGYAILTSVGMSDYDGLWTRVALLTAFSAILYLAVGVAERAALRRIAGVSG